MTASSLSIVRFELMRFNAADLLQVASINSGTLARGSPIWLRQIRDSLRPDAASANTWDIEIEDSRYALTDRSARSTFSLFYRHELMPLSLRFRTPLSYKSSILTTELISARFHAVGALSFQLRMRASSTSSHTVEALISDYHQTMVHTRDLLRRGFALLREHINRVPSAITFKQDLTESIFENMAYYEVVDVDYDKTLCVLPPFSSTVDEKVARQYARLLSMSRSSYAHSSIDRIRDLLSSNLGYRHDECWITNDQRLLRTHPEDDHYLRAFLDDIILACDIAVMERAAGLHLNSRLRNSILELCSTTHAVDTDKSLASRSWVDVTDLYSLRIARLANDRGVSHSFFVRVMRAVREAIDEEGVLVSLAQSYEALAGMLDTVHSHFEMKTSLNIADETRALARSANALNRTICILTVVMFVVALLQLWVAFTSHQVDPGTPPSSGPRVEEPSTPISDTSSASDTSSGAKKDKPKP